MSNIPFLLRRLRIEAVLTYDDLARHLQSSLSTVVRWEEGTASPSPAQQVRLFELIDRLDAGDLSEPAQEHAFASIRSPRARRAKAESMASSLADLPLAPILDRITAGRFFASSGEAELSAMLKAHKDAALTAEDPPPAGMSAGKNTYTYDAHTYHTKVPPQGIAELLRHYLPQGGLVLDPFAGSGMTGVAARVQGADCILNELSPAACFIARQFTATAQPAGVRAALDAVLSATAQIRRELYATIAPDGERVEFEYVIWSYRVRCDRCGAEFTLWDHCRSYGRGVREHKILSRFPCPACGQTIEKGSLERTSIVPVAVALKTGALIELHEPAPFDTDLISRLENEISPIEGYFPRTPVLHGMNLRQPIKQGLSRIDMFYTRRNLIALSHLWHTIHRIENAEFAAFAAFVFTSLYQRVTRFSEFRFWGGSGNAAHFNVPHIFKEANVFTTFERKAKSILDHLETTAASYNGRAVVVNGSATSLDYLPDQSVDLVFADPPFGGNIHYSDMNVIWESWLGRFTDTRDEAIVNRLQGKGVAEYQALMTRSLAECSRVLRDGHWMLLVFMNSSEQIWNALRASVAAAGFSIRQVDVFDKQHSTFKQLVDESAAGADLVLHCLKGRSISSTDREGAEATATESIASFLRSVDLDRYRVRYLHIQRAPETDYRMLYSHWLAKTIAENGKTTGFADFRKLVRILIGK